jgi:hypothetical protein
MGRQRCSTFMISGGLPSVRGDGDGREKREKALFENVGRTYQKKKKRGKRSERENEELVFSKKNNNNNNIYIN